MMSSDSSAGATPKSPCEISRSVPQTPTSSTRTSTPSPVGSAHLGDMGRARGARFRDECLHARASALPQHCALGGRADERAGSGRRHRGRTAAAGGCQRGEPRRRAPPARARASSVPASTSIVIGSPSRTMASGPPRAASGATWPTIRPRVAPEKRPSVTSATESPRPAPTTDEVTLSISRMPGPPAGPS